MKLGIFFTLLSFTSIILFFVGINESFISDIYSEKIFFILNLPLRIITNLFSFSIGDILYLLIFFSFIFFLIKEIKKGLINVFNLIFKFLFSLILIIFLFINLWGWNYQRKNIYEELGLKKNKYSVESLEKTTLFFLEKVNEYKNLTLNDTLKTKFFIRNNVKNPAKKIKSELYFLKSYEEKVKTSLFSSLMSFMGITGYYNPFTSEAQVNKNVPKFIYPFICCHEISHQMGIASEDEANFIGFLMCLKSEHDYFKYSAYFEMYLYCLKELKKYDFKKAENISKNLSPFVKDDIKELYNYYHKYDSVLEKISSLFYDNYLKVNKQKDGIKSYNNVVNLLIEYYKF